MEPFRIRLESTSGAAETDSVTWPGAASSRSIRPTRVHVAEHEMAAQTVADAERPFEVDLAAGREAAERGDAQRLRAHVELRHPAADARHGQACAVHRDAVADANALGESAQFHPQPPARAAAVSPRTLPVAFDDSGEHIMLRNFQIPISNFQAQSLLRSLGIGHWILDIPHRPYTASALTKTFWISAIDRRKAFAHSEDSN